MQSTENLQRILRRAIFRSHFREEQNDKQAHQTSSIYPYKIILTFFELCETFFKS